MTEIKINCADGVTLGATLYEPSAPKAAIMIGPATGIRQKFYRSFALFLMEKGYVVITFDNRGIGDSKGKNINDGNPSLVNWGRLDMTAVLNFLKEKYPQLDYHLIGHSAGGQLVGLMENATDLKSIFNFACSSGSIHFMKKSFLLSSHFFLNFLIPVSNFIFGYARIDLAGMGEPLPKKVAAQWRKWCNGKGYVDVYLKEEKPAHLYDQLKIPIQWLHASDDHIANTETVKDMVRVFPQANSSITTLHPSDFNYEEIGHMKFFSSKKKKLWNYAVDWLEVNSN